MTKKLRMAGYWWSEENRHLPVPKASEKPWKGKKAFLEALALVENKAQEKHCKGWSNCRICDRKNGSVTYVYNGWQWPCGFKHYIADHNVKPSQEFIKFVMNDGVRPGMPKETCDKRLLTVKALSYRAFDYNECVAFVPQGVLGEVVSFMMAESVPFITVRWFVGMLSAEDNLRRNLIEEGVSPTDIEYVGLDRVSWHRPCYDPATDSKVLPEDDTDDIPF